MRSRITYFLAVLLVVVLTLGVASAALAGAQYMDQIPANVQPKNCNLCHTSNIPALNEKGQAWVNAGKDWSVFTGGAQPAAAQEEAKKELPKTGGNPFINVGIGVAMVMFGLLMGKKRVRKDE